MRVLKFIYGMCEETCEPISQHCRQLLHENAHLSLLKDFFVTPEIMGRQFHARMKCELMCASSFDLSAKELRGKSATMNKFFSEI